MNNKFDFKVKDAVRDTPGNFILMTLLTMDKKKLHWLMSTDLIMMNHSSMKDYKNSLQKVKTLILW